MNLHKIFLIKITVILVTACGGQTAPSTLARTETALVATQEKRNKKVKVPVTFANAITSLRLADTAATSFKLDVDGCASGYSANNLVSPATLDLYEFDPNCMLSLDEVVVDGVTYTPKTGSDFDSTPAVGESATFENTSVSKEITVVIITTVTVAGVATADTIEFEFYDIENSSDDTVISDNEMNAANAGQTVTVDGLLAPMFVINSINFVDVENDGKGTFDIDMSCDSVDATTGLDATDSVTCHGVTIDKVDYKLIADGGDVRNYAYLSGLTTGWTSAATTDGFGDGENGLNDNSITVGGFRVNNLSGPVTLHSYPNMILILRTDATTSGGYYSYTHFDIDFTAISN